MMMMMILIIPASKPHRETRPMGRYFLVIFSEAKLTVRSVPLSLNKFASCTLCIRNAVVTLTERYERLIA